MPLLLDLVVLTATGFQQQLPFSQLFFFLFPLNFPLIYCLCLIYELNGVFNL